MPTQRTRAFLLSVALAAPLLLAGCSHPQPVAYYPPPPPNYSQIVQQGYHDGYYAAQNDVRRGNPPGFDHHPRFRNPPVPPPAVPEYRQGFREGYERFLHPNGGPPPPPGI